MAGIPNGIHDLDAIRRALTVSPDVAFGDGGAMVSTLTLLDGDPADAAFTVTLATGRVVTLHLFLDPPDAAIPGTGTDDQLVANDTILGAGTYDAGLKPTSMIRPAATAQPVDLSDGQEAALLALADHGVPIMAGVLAGQMTANANGRVTSIAGARYAASALVDHGLATESNPEGGTRTRYEITDAGRAEAARRRFATATGEDKQ